MLFLYKFYLFLFCSQDLRQKILQAKKQGKDGKKKSKVEADSDEDEDDSDDNDVEQVGFEYSHFKH